MGSRVAAQDITVFTVVQRETSMGQRASLSEDLRRKCRAQRLEMNCADASHLISEMAKQEEVLLMLPLAGKTSCHEGSSPPTVGARKHARGPDWRRGASGRSHWFGQHRVPCLSVSVDQAPCQQVKLQALHSPSSLDKPVNPSHVPVLAATYFQYTYQFKLVFFLHRWLPLVKYLYMERQSEACQSESVPEFG